MNKNVATLTNYSCSTHFLVNVVQKKHAQENMKIAPQGRKTDCRKWSLGFHHWRVLKVKHHHMLAYPFSRSKTVPRCWCNIQEFWRWCPIFINQQRVYRKKVLSWWLETFMLSRMWMSWQFVLPYVTLHPKLGSVVSLQVVAENWSVLASQCTQRQNDLHWVLRLG